MTAFMTGLTIAISAAALWGTTPARAQDHNKPQGKLDLGAMKCKDFFANPRDRLALIIGWLEGSYAGKGASPVLDLDQIQRHGEKIGALCARNREKGLMTVAEEALKQ